VVAVLKHDIDLNRRVASTVEDFPAKDGRDGGHGASFGLIAVRARDTLGPRAGFYRVQRAVQSVLAERSRSTMADMRTYRGGCHCGRIRYEVATALSPVLSCNCSICQKRGYLLTFAPRAAFKLISGEPDLTDYQR
jgi:hypothetical protein